MYDGISIQHDLTKDQRKELREMIDLAKRKEDEDPTGNYVYKVRGPPGRKHIKRFRKVVEIEAEADPEQPAEEADPGQPPVAPVTEEESEQE